MVSLWPQTEPALSATAVPTSIAALGPAQPVPRQGVRLWLFMAAALVLLTVLIGGWTRLTESGLSIAEWRPVTGIVPPLDSVDWNAAFESYKKTYQGRVLNFDMTLDDFKTIYLWEWWHRIFARLVFLSVLVPFVIFSFRQRFDHELERKILIVLAMIVAQGALGWFMVTTGLANDVKVKPYSLAMHLSLAAAIFCALVSIGLGQDRRPLPETPVNHLTKNSIRLIAGVIFSLIVFGALVAGYRAGRTYDTWPLMAGELIPGGLFALDPWYTNFYKNDLTVQFIHRLLAYGLFAVTWLHAHRVRRFERDPGLKFGAGLLFSAVIVQIFLGIITIWLTVPAVLGSLHQLSAFCVFAIAIWHLYEIERHEEGMVAALPSDPVQNERDKSALRPEQIAAGMAVQARKAAGAAVYYGKQYLDERRK